MRYILFDLDGTLIDSKRDLYIAVNESFSSFGLPKLTEERIFSFVGSGVKKLISDSLEFVGAPEKFDVVFEFFLSYYYNHLLDNTRLYDGVREVLEALKKKNKKMFVISNKGIIFVKRILKGLDVDNFFEDIVGGDSFVNRKPHPQPIIEVLLKHRAQKEEAVMVGDSENDLEAAKAAGLKCVWVAYGFRDESILERYSVDFVAREPKELLSYLL